MNSLKDLLKCFSTACFLFLLLIGGCYGALQYKYWKFDHLEEHAKRAITPAELQTWATNLMAEYATYTDLQFGQIHTNYPAQLNALCHSVGACWVVVCNNSSQKNPDYVVIHWGIKPTGDFDLVIGPPDYKDPNPKARVWAPGIYFYRH